MIEQMTGKSITELFDWMVGTSTGAILALGMVYGQYKINVMWLILGCPLRNCFSLPLVGMGLLPGFPFAPS